MTNKKENIVGNILIIDDTPENLRLLSNVLKNCGHNVRAAKTGKEGLASVKSKLPDLILLDIKLPDINGFEVCKLIKADKTSQEIPVIFLSALQEITDKLMGFEVGGVDYITKPFKSEEVIIRVQTHLDLSIMRSQLKKSEESFRAIFENNSSAISIIEPDTTISMVNDAYCQISGYSREEVVGMSWTKQIPPEDLERLKEYNRKRLLDSESAPNKYEFKFYHKNGNIKYGLMSLSMTLDKKKIIASFLDITDQKEVQGALIESEKMLRESQEIAILGSYEWNLSTGLWKSSKILDSIFGIDEHYVRSLEGWENLIKTEWQLIMNDYLIKEVLGQHMRFDKEYQIIKQDTGLERWVHGLGQLEFDSIGQPAKLIGTIIDITERKNSEKELSDSEEKYRTLVEVSIHAIFINQNNHIIYLNPAAVKLFGAETAEQILGKSPLEIFHPDYHKIVTDRLKGMSDSGGTAPLIEEKIIQLDGTILDVEVAATLFTFKGEKAFHVVLRDISERKRAEENLRLSEENFRNVFEHAAVGKSMTSIDGTIKTNKAFSLILGYSNSELSKLKWQDITHPDDISKDNIIINSVVSGKRKSARWEKRYIHKNGSIVWVDISTALQVNTDGKPLYFITTINDITVKKQIEKEIKLLNETLEQRVIDRTAELEASNRELEAFSYSVSHDLRAPLRHISGYSDFLVNEFSKSLPDKAKHYLETISISAHQMGILIDDLLLFSKTGRVELQKNAVEMDKLLNEVTSHYTSLLPDRNIEWEIHHLPEVYGDSGLLRIVWTNLVDNAVKYTRLKEKAVIKIGCKSENGEYIFSIGDNGVGFDMQYSEKLFGVFQRLHSSVQFEGTGIGLANVQRIILRHNGRTWAKAEPDKGAVFYFSIPKELKSNRKRENVSK